MTCLACRRLILLDLNLDQTANAGLLINLYAQGDASGLSVSEALRSFYSTPTHEDGMVVRRDPARLCALPSPL